MKLKSDVEDHVDVAACDATKIVTFPASEMSLGVMTSIKILLREAKATRRSCASYPPTFTISSPAALASGTLSSRIVTMFFEVSDESGDFLSIVSSSSISICQ